MKKMEDVVGFAHSEHAMTTTHKQEFARTVDALKQDLKMRLEQIDLASRVGMMDEYVIVVFFFLCFLGLLLLFIYLLLLLFIIYYYTLMCIVDTDATEVPRLCLINNIIICIHGVSVLSKFHILC